MAIVLIALVTLSVSAFAADNGKQTSESNFQENVVVKVANTGKLMKEEEEFEILTPEEISSMEETEDPDDLLEVFKLVNNYLDPNGLFVFDINTIYKFENVLGCNSFCETTENSAYTWENYYDNEEQINEFYTNFFIETDNGLYERHEEYHYERGYSIEDIKELLEEAGLVFEAVYDELTFHEPTERSQRIFFVAREKGKERK